jgi:hypothetical protein
MKTIKPHEVPEILTEEVINILAEMAMAFPVTKEWRQVAEVLTDEQLIIVNNRVSEINRKFAADRKAGMSEKEKAEEADQWERIKNDNDPHRFYGNMGQPETPQEFKNRYGVWPPGYDENGNKLP